MRFYLVKKKKKEKENNVEIQFHPRLLNNHGSEFFDDLMQE